jgi:bacterioferritin-associated ferredoxin
MLAIENGVCTRKKLTHCFGIGKDCGKCNKEVIALLEQRVKPIQPPSATNQLISARDVEPLLL